MHSHNKVFFGGLLITLSLQIFAADDHDHGFFLGTDTKPLADALGRFGQSIERAKLVDIDSKAVAAALEKARLVDLQPVADKLPQLLEPLTRTQLIDTRPLGDGLRDATKPLAAAIQNAQFKGSVTHDLTKINADVTHRIDITPQAQEAVDTASIRGAGCCGCGVALCTPTISICALPCTCPLLCLSSILLIAPTQKIKSFANGGIQFAQENLESCLPAKWKQKFFKQANQPTAMLGVQPLPALRQPTPVAPSTQLEHKATLPPAKQDGKQA